MSNTQEIYDAVLLLDSLSSASDAKMHIHGYDQASGSLFGSDDALVAASKLSMLQKITARRIYDYLQKDFDESDLQKKILETEIRLGPRLNLQDVIQTQSPKMALAAEFKRASPSKGDIAAHLSAGEQACKYASAGASVISVLVESHWFKGSFADLAEVREQTQQQAQASGVSRPAILCKDFVLSKHHIMEAAAAGADTVLLIVAITPADLLKDLIDFCRSIDMEPLVEVHAGEELDVALKAGARVIGVNNRNLHTFKMDMNTTDRTAEALASRELTFYHSSIDANNPPSYSLCSLSGMSNADDVDRYRQVGVGMCLIGESLMRSPDPAATIASFCLDPQDYEKLNLSNTSGAYTAGTKIIKVCGITNVEDALEACRSGASLIGLIFVEKSKRNISPEKAKEVVSAVRLFGERDTRIEIDHTSSKGAGAVPSLVKSSRLLQNASRRPLVVGVFQNKVECEVRDIVEKVGLDCVQLHGDEGMEACSKCGVPAIRVVHMEAGATPNVDKILASLTSDPVAILFDTSVKGAQGGTGVTFDWNLAKEIQSKGLPVIVAGGLTPDNVASAVTSISPWGIDVSSGVEATPGKKDHEKVRKFVSNAKVAAEQASKGF